MKRAGLISLVALSTMGVLALGAACAPNMKLVDKGGECFVATDCAPGLICLEQPNKTRVCGDDLSRVAGRPPPEAGAADAGEDLDGASDSAAPVDSGSSEPDTGAKDSGGD